MAINPLQANLEICAEKTLTKCQKCRILCGYESVLVTLLVLAIVGTIIFVFSLYSGALTGKVMWVFSAGLFILSTGSFILVRTCIAIFVPKKEKRKK